MSKDLNEAFNNAKKSRRVMSKHMIWESGVSKSQFYRIIQGKETPSLETKKRISQSLGIDNKQFDFLHDRSKSEHEKDPLPTPKRTWIFPLVVSSILLVGFTILIAKNSSQTSELTVTKDISDPEDRTEFIMDVTIPDGTTIPVNTEFVKTWRVKNTGNVVWKNRYLMRITPASNLLCSSPSMVPIPETAPGETVDISVKFVTPHLPGSCRTDWKTADNRGNLYYPDMHGLYSIVVVTD